LLAYILCNYVSSKNYKNLSLNSNSYYLPTNKSKYIVTKKFREIKNKK